MAAKVVVLGGSFAGLTAAIYLKAEVGDDVDVPLVCDREESLMRAARVARALGGPSLSAHSGPVFHAYATYPLPLDLALKWFVSGLPMSVVLGVLASLVHRRE